MESLTGSSVPKKASSRLEKLVNIAIIVVAITSVIGLVRLAFQWFQRPVEIVPVAVGTQLELPGVDWTSTQQTLVLVLSTTCHYCSESAPLYQRLTKELAARPDIRVMAVLPQPDDQARKYLAGLNVSIGEIHQRNLAELGVDGTPTLILADKTGKVTGLWLGKLAGKAEAEFLERVGLQPTAPHSEVSASDLKQLIKSKEAVIVDVGNRDLYQLNHVDGAVNIPLDELDTRGVNELAADKKTVIYCHVCEHDGESELARDILLRNGFTQVSILKGGLKSWESETLQKTPAGQPPDSVKKKAAGSTR